MLFDPARHEPLHATPWDARRARETIVWIVRDAEQQLAAHPGGCPPHPRDLEPGDDPSRPFPSLYFGTAGVHWALRDLRARGAVGKKTFDAIDFDMLRESNREWLRTQGGTDFDSYLFGDLAIDLMAWGERPTPALREHLQATLERSIGHPALELMWGSPGSLLAASFLYGGDGDDVWAELFRRIASDLEARLRWSDAHGCHYWEQQLYGQRCSYLDGVHGFVATAHALIRGRHLLDAAIWQRWQQGIVQTVLRTVTREGMQVNWRAQLDDAVGIKTKWLMQYCHGAPGFVVCLADLPDPQLDPLLLAAGETIWAAGPLAKGSNLCHGTAGNGYALLKLYARTGDAVWLQRARAFAMHAIGQTEAEHARTGRLRHSLWTGDEGLAIYLWDCIRERAAFPTLDRFYPDLASV